MPYQKVDEENGHEEDEDEKHDEVQLWIRKLVPRVRSDPDVQIIDTPQHHDAGAQQGNFGAREPGGGLQRHKSCLEQCNNSSRNHK